MVYLQKAASRSEASRREYAIKQLSRSEKLLLIEQGGRFESHIDVGNGGGNAVELLSGASGFSKQKIKSVMQKGAVWLTRGKSTQRLRRVKKKLQPEDELHLYYNGNVLAQSALEAELVADCQEYSVWLKPSGMMSQGSKWGDHTTVVRYAETYLDRVTYQIHRLDRATSGLILVAHSKKMARILTGMFEQRTIKKSYQAIVSGQFAEGVITLDSEIEGRTAISHVKRLGYDCDKSASLVEVDIETGRKHQIRRHLSEAGFPIVGDRLYGGMVEGDQPLDLQLMAVKLAFSCPLSGEGRVLTVGKTLGELAAETLEFRWL
ncbi:MAG: RNA pseudouridine synthase [Gammaproteobacteria bacterium]|nr:MAG: RNA pseudouridine synthase [Gammaproteobacteria bacterium]RLA22544.1 MAG: RNA pseudouridine synthase [Gammaproteobacteria bacterium]